MYMFCPVFFAAALASMREIPIKSQYFWIWLTCAGESHPHRTPCTHSSFPSFSIWQESRVASDDPALHRMAGALRYSFVHYCCLTHPSELSTCAVFFHWASLAHTEFRRPIMLSWLTAHLVMRLWHTCKYKCTPKGLDVIYMEHLDL